VAASLVTKPVELRDIFVYVYEALVLVVGTSFYLKRVGT
jgi:hypothetical protein